MTLYATLSDVQSVMTANETAASAGAINKIMSDLRVVSRRVDREFNARRPLFAPYIETRRIRITSDIVNSRDGTLLVAPQGSLLALAGATAGDTTLTVGTHIEGWPDSAYPPFPYLRLTAAASSGWYDYCTTDGDPLFAEITGVWGMHRDYASAWMHVDDLQADISASASTLTVANAAGVDAYGVTPRFSPGNLLRIDDEFLEVIGISTNTLTVRRGVNGSTAAAHTGAVGTGGANISTWQVEEPVRRAVARQTAMLYARRGAYTSVEVNGMSEVRFPSDWLSEVRATLADYAYW